MKAFRQVEMLPSRSRLRRQLPLLALLAAASFGLVADAVRRYVAQAEQVERLRSDTFHRQLIAQRQATQQAEQKQTRQRLDELSRPLLPVTSFPWDELLLSTERLNVPGVRLTSLTVDARQGTARLVLECGGSAQAAGLSLMLDEGRPSGQRRWRLIRTRSLPGVSAQVETELQFSSKSSDEAAVNNGYRLIVLLKAPSGSPYKELTDQFAKGVEGFAWQLPAQAAASAPQ